jgi:hypothetical protein
MGDLVALVRNFVMKWFDDHNLFPEYVAAESAAAEASNAQGVAELTTWRDELQPAVQEYADKYGRGTTPEARATDFLDRMEKVHQGDIAALPETMPVSDFFDVYGGIVSDYQALTNKLKEFETAYDAKSGLHMFVNWSRDHINNTARGMSSQALRNVRNTADKMDETLGPGLLGMRLDGLVPTLENSAFGTTIVNAMANVESKKLPIVRGARDIIASTLGIERDFITDTNYQELKERALAQNSADSALLGRAGTAVISNNPKDALSKFTEAELSRLDFLIDRSGNLMNFSFRALYAPRSSQEAAAAERRLSFQDAAENALEDVYATMHRWVDENGLSANNYLDQGWKAYAITEGAKDITVTIKLVDPEGKEKIITTDLAKNDGIVDFGSTHVTGVIGNDVNTILEAYSPL